MSTQNMDYKPQQASPSLCRNGCGFYSTNDKDGLCSLCFKEKLKKEADSQSPPTTSSSTQTPPSTGTSSGPSTPSSQSFSSPQASLTSGSTSAPDSAPESSTSSTSSTSTIVSCEAASSHTSSPKKTLHPLDEDSDPVPVKKPKKNRCVSCKKKLGLTGFTCRCGGQFCSIHRYSDKHDCPFDYKAMGEQEISQNNPQIVAQKVSKL